MAVLFVVVELLGAARRFLEFLRLLVVVVVWWLDT